MRERGNVGVAVPAIVLRPQAPTDRPVRDDGAGRSATAEWSTSRSWSSVEASGDRRRFAAAGAVDDHHPVGLVIVEETLRERADGEGERDDQQSQPEAAHAEDLAELTAGDDQDVVHGLDLRRADEVDEDVVQACKLLFEAP